MARAKRTNLIDKEVGARVRMRRMMLGMTQAQLGDPLGVTFQQVQKYEKGLNRLVAGRLQQIARILDVPVAFFFDGTKAGKPAEGDPLAFLATSAGPGALRLASAFTRIADAELRRRIIDQSSAASFGTTARRAGSTRNSRSP